MKGSVFAQIIKHFNDGNFEEAQKLWADDIKIYDLKTEQLLIGDKKALMENDKPYIEDKENQAELISLVKFGDVEVGYLKSLKTGQERVQIGQVKDGMLINSWFTRLPMEEE